MNETPLERLGAAISAFFEETGSFPPSAVMSGWVVVATHSRVQTEDPNALPLVSGAQYAIGPETSTVEAAGMARFLDVVVERATWGMLNGSSDEDDE